MSPNFVCKEIEGTYLRESIHHSLQEHDKDACNLVECIVYIFPFINVLDRQTFKRGK